MRPDNKEYAQMTKKLSPPSPKWKDFIWAYSVGGFICVIGQLLMELFISDECGFSSANYFCLIFKKREAVSPATYRKMYE